MVVFLLAVSKGQTKEKDKPPMNSREFTNQLKNLLEKEKIDQKRVVGINLDNMKNLVSSSLDSLLKINDDLIKNDQEIEGFLKALEKKIYELEPKQELMVSVKGTMYKIDEGISLFTWDENRFPKNQKTIEEILVKINERYVGTRQNLKVKQDEINTETEKLKAKKRSDIEAASLMKVDYRDIVEKCKDKMITTDYLSTVLCFVPNAQIDVFLKNYMKLADGMVVPLSALKLSLKEDDKISLFRVVVMTHAKDDFRNQCQGSLRIQCRDYDEEEIKRKPGEKLEIKQMTDSINEKRANLLRNSVSGYSEVYSALLHLKFLRLYVEASLKYGTSEYFSSIVFIPLAKEQRAVKAFIKTYNDTEDKDWYGTKEDLKEAEDFYPFILIKLGCPSTINN